VRGAARQAVGKWGAEEEKMGRGLESTRNCLFWTDNVANRE